MNTGKIGGARSSQSDGHWQDRRVGIDGRTHSRRGQHRPEPKQTSFAQVSWMEESSYRLSLVTLPRLHRAPPCRRQCCPFLLPLTPHPRGWAAPFSKALVVFMSLRSFFRAQCLLVEPLVPGEGLEGSRGDIPSPTK